MILFNRFSIGTDHKKTEYNRKLLSVKVFKIKSNKKKLINSLKSELLSFSRDKYETTSSSDQSFKYER